MVERITTPNNTQALAPAMTLEMAPTETVERRPVARDGFDRGGVQTVQFRPQADAEAEVRRKLNALIDRRFGGNARAAFDHFDRDGDGCLSRSEVSRALREAGIGNRLTRGFYVDGIMERFDRDGDGRLCWSEFSSIG